MVRARRAADAGQSAGAAPDAALVLRRDRAPDRGRRADSVGRLRAQGTISTCSTHAGELEHLAHVRRRRLERQRAVVAEALAHRDEHADARRVEEVEAAAVERRCGVAPASTSSISASRSCGAVAMSISPRTTTTSRRRRTSGTRAPGRPRTRPSIGCRRDRGLLSSTQYDDRRVIAESVGREQLDLVDAALDDGRRLGRSANPGAAPRGARDRRTRCRRCGSRSARRCRRRGCRPAPSWPRPSSSPGASRPTSGPVGSSAVGRPSSLTTSAGGCPAFAYRTRAVAGVDHRDERGEEHLVAHVTEHARRWCRARRPASAPGRRAPCAASPCTGARGCPRSRRARRCRRRSARCRRSRVDEQVVAVTGDHAFGRAQSDRRPSIRRAGRRPRVRAPSAA